MNWAAAVSSATSGAPICLRMSKSTTIMQHHCHRDRRRRSNLPVSAKSRTGAKPCMFGDPSRARKQATAKKPDSRISANNACVLTRTSLGAKKPVAAAGAQQRYEFVCRIMS